MYHYKECGLANIHLLNGYEKVDTGYGVGFSVHNVDGLHKAIGENIASVTRPLTGEEVRFLRIELDMSQKGLGRILGCTEQTVANWEKNKTNIARTSDVALRHYYAEKVLRENPEISELLDTLSSLDRTIQELEIKLSETELGWKVAA